MSVDFAALVPALDDPDVIVFIRDRDGRYVYVNDNYGRLLPKNREEVIGKTNRELYGDAAKQWEMTDALTWASGTPTTTEETQWSPEERRWKRYAMTKLPALASDGNTYLVGITVELKDNDAMEYDRRLEILRGRVMSLLRAAPVDE